MKSTSKIDQEKGFQTTYSSFALAELPLTIAPTP